MDDQAQKQQPSEAPVPATNAPKVYNTHENFIDHEHNGGDATPINQNNVLHGPKGFGNQYFAREYNNGSVSTTASIDWGNGNVQYVTLAAATTLTFKNPQPGTRLILHVAGAFIPTWPSTVRWPAGVTPTATATAGKKDIYGFIYSGTESLYDGAQAPNYATT